MGEERWDVFVSDGHEDGDWVGALAGNLHRDDFDGFVDGWELVGGDRVMGRLEQAIGDSANGVLVLSTNALSRSWVREKYEALLRQAVEDPDHRWLMPVLDWDAELSACMATTLWADGRGAVSTGRAYDRKLDEVERALRDDARGR